MGDCILLYRVCASPSNNLITTNWKDTINNIRGIGNTIGFCVESSSEDVSFFN